MNDVRYKKKLVLIQKCSVCASEMLCASAMLCVPETLDVSVIMHACMTSVSETVCDHKAGCVCDGLCANKRLGSP